MCSMNWHTWYQALDTTDQLSQPQHITFIEHTSMGHALTRPIKRNEWPGADPHPSDTQIDRLNMIALKQQGRTHNSSYPMGGIRVK